MSYATIMVQVDVDGDLNGRVRLAAQLANRFQSHLIGISSWMARPPFVVEGVVIDPELTAEDIAARTDALSKRGETFKAAAGLESSRVEWRSSQQFPTEFIAKSARAADLVVISRERERSDPYLYPEPGELLLRVGRPVLAVPLGVSSLSGRRVVVAWKDTREARRAVRDALPFLRQADQVILAEICASPDDVTPAQNGLRDVAQYLACHRITAVTERVRPIEGTAEDSLLHLVQAESADLIVAGAYGHSRLGEWIFGGMTQALLARSPVSCLFSH